MVIAEYNILNPKYFLKHMSSISNIYYEGIIQFGKNIRMVGIDPSRIAVFEFVLGSDCIETTNTKNLFAPICIDDFDKILKRFKNPSEFKIIYDTDRQKVTVKGKIGNKTKTFNISTIEFDGKFDMLPTSLSKIKYNAVFRVNSNDLLEAIKDVEIYSSCFSLKLQMDGLHVFTNSVIGDIDTIIHIDVDAPIKDVASFSVRYIQNIIKNLGSTDLIIMLKKDYPICIYDKLSEKSYILYYIAPRVEDDNFE